MFLKIVTPWISEKCVLLLLRKQTVLRGRGGGQMASCGAGWGAGRGQNTLRGRGASPSQTMLQGRCCGG